MYSARGGAEAEASGVACVLEDLLARELGCAPDVVAGLLRRLDGDREAVVQVAGVLDVTQRRGLRPLPSPLPLVPAIETAFSDFAPALREKRALLEQALDAGSPCTASLCGGRVLGARVDERSAAWILGTSTAEEVMAAHRRLARRSEHEDAAASAWHRASGSSARDAGAAVELLRAARQLRADDESLPSLRFAALAAQHSTGAVRDQALLIAGVSAMGSGYAAEAAARLSELFRVGSEHAALRGAAVLLAAETHLRGVVPAVAPVDLRPRTDTTADWYAYARAAAFAAALCAERGDRGRAREWLDQLRLAAAKVGAERELRDPVVSMTWLLLGESEADDARGAGPLTGVVYGALRAAVAGDVDAGLRILAAGDYHQADARDPFIAGFERSPLVEAHRAVAEGLLMTWRGDLGAAREHLAAAALKLPVAIPFAGLGVILARRLDLAVIGEIGPISRSLTAALPSPTRVDHLVDRTVRAHLDGRSDEAVALLRLWIERGAPQPVLAVPGIDEIAPGGVDVETIPRHRVEPPEMTLARTLRLRASTIPQAAWASEGSRLEDAAGGIRSPFERARVSAAFGVRAVIHDDPRAGRRHLEAALALFEESGALAWAEQVAERIRLLDQTAEYGDELGDAVEAIRRRWAPMLTHRELQLALAVVGGASNREIASSFTVSVRTVEVHLGRIFAKLGVRTRVELMLLALRSARHG
ncbi:LuxR C-terminal-related transcriptional regulator [Microbacterium hydrocarbonoxydans]|uniref:LuxR C-terminal-related transcriptional regulator n=1 Tax=Microbacterium hydrocarbonoxydans TaxID=273678 RepID=UPI00203E0F2C|nr:LuxR family transcriptional regulator [Microbacterium hydrocarbonoxydans]MCM3779159.1 LuxR C-terminal-related transcriptional regulator [Microbacterium hydrocarbonoxydans]